MNFSNSKQKIALLFVTMLLVGVACSDRDKAKTTGEDRTNTYTIGIVTWVGYGPLFIAQEKGFFKDERLDLKIEIMDGPGQRESAYLSGVLHFLPNTPDAFAIFATQGAAGKIVMPMDESYGADGLVAKMGISNIAELKGKKVGFQSGITSHFFLLYLLHKAGLSGQDILQENLGAGEAGAAFVAGKLDAAVTWEPWLTKAKELPEGNVLATSKDTPGLLADVLMVSDDMIASHRNDVKAFMRAWFRAINYMKENKAECISIISKAFKLDASEVKGMLETARFFTLNESQEYFGTIETPGKVFEVFEAAAKLYNANGVIDKIPSINKLVDTSLLQELKLEKKK